MKLFFDSTLVVNNYLLLINQRNFKAFHAGKRIVNNLDCLKPFWFCHGPFGEGFYRFFFKTTKLLSFLVQV
jgi:hypothetical protein